MKAGIVMISLMALFTGLLISAFFFENNPLPTAEGNKEAIKVVDWEDRNYSDESVSVNFFGNSLVNNRTRLYYGLDKSSVCRGKSIDRMKRFNNINGMSMLPTIDRYSTVYYVDYDHNGFVRQDIAVGDIVFTSEIIHRVVGVYPDYVITMGDNNDFFENVFYDDIKGVVCAIART